MICYHQSGIMKIKNMRNILVFGLYFVLSSKEVFGESENEIKRGTYPYMAVVYYPDVSIVGPSGTRFTRSAIVIRSDWLISSSLETNDTQLAFPQKTLVARAGAIAIDSNFTVNEDEGEQEREIIQFVRPTNFNASQWWSNDITLLKTLLPFIMTPTVTSTTLSGKYSSKDKICYILVFAKKYKNSTDDKVLMQLAVELLPAANDSCGVHFRNETMICATDSDANKNTPYEPDFCLSNGGGPLICEGEVIGLQTYIDYNCNPPYLYQLLSVWDDFISCAIDYKCQQHCGNICVNIDKDELVTTQTSEAVVNIVTDQSTEDSNDEERYLPDTTVKAMILTDNETPTPTKLSTSEITTATESTTILATENEETTTASSPIDDLETSWPKEKLIGYRKKLDEAENNENIDRTANVEAQHHEKKKKARSAAESYVTGKIGLIHSLLFTLLFITCVI